MKISKIQTILKAQTCNLFSQEWYDKTALLLSEVDKLKEEVKPEFDPRFDNFQVGVRYYNREIDIEDGYELRNFLSSLEKFLVIKGLILTKGKNHKGRFFSIQ